MRFRTTFKTVNFLLLPLLIFNSCSVTESMINNVGFIEATHNSVAKAYKKIYITGEGHIISRILINNVGEKLANYIKRQGADVSFSVLKRNPDTDAELRRIQAETQCDAILLISQSDVAKVLERNDVTYMFQTRSIKVTESLDLSVLEKGSVIWSGKLYLNVNLNRKRAYKLITEKIIAQLISNKIIRANSKPRV